MSKNERIAALEVAQRASHKALESLIAVIKHLEDFSITDAERIDALEKRLDATRDQLLKTQADAAGSKPLDLRDSKFYPGGAQKLPPDIAHFNAKAPTITNYNRSSFEL